MAAHMKYPPELRERAIKLYRTSRVFTRSALPVSGAGRVRPLR